MIGKKFDGDKLRYDLLPYDAINKVVDVLTYGAVKYGDDNWKHVKDKRRRYFAAAMRHMTAWFLGEQYDAESKKSHLAHAACCILFLLDEINLDKK
jgi:hypothetical protein